MPGPRNDWPFSARAEELRLLVDTVLEAPLESANAVVVGAAGVGKSRLARELTNEARSSGVPVVSAIATRATGRTPYGALAHLAPSPPLEYDDLGAWYRAFASALTVDGQSALLVIDDAQWLDDASAALLLHLAGSDAARVLLTVRRGEQAPEPVTTMWKDQVAARIDLQPLSAREIGTLVSGGLGGQVSESTASALAKASGGNVLFVRELVEAAVESGAMAREHGVWRWDGSVVLAPRLTDVLTQRLAHLTHAEREALAVVALGEPLGLDEVRQVVTEDALNRLESEQLIRVLSPTSDRPLVTLGHPLYGEIVVTELPELRRRQLVVRLADAIDDRGTITPAEQVKIATWRLDAGATVDGAQLVEGSILASRSFDPALGERLARAAIVARAGTRASVALGRALVATNRFEEAEEVLAPLEDDVLEIDDAELHQVYLERRLSALYMGLGRGEEMLEVLDRFDAAHSDADPGHRERARTLSRAYRSAVLLDHGRLEDVVEVNSDVLRAPEASPLAQMYALENTGEALAYLGRTTEARGVIDRLAALGDTDAPMSPEPARHRSCSRRCTCIWRGVPTRRSPRSSRCCPSSSTSPTRTYARSSTWSAPRPKN